MGVSFGVLGPVVASDDQGRGLDLRGPRHRAVLARLLIARGRVVPMTAIVDDLWVSPPERAAGAVQTFVGALRRGLEPARPPRTPSRMLVTEGGGYALRLGPADSVDAWEFEAAVGAQDPGKLRDALARWRGPAYADLIDAPWIEAERRRLDELRLTVLEDLAEAELATGRAEEVIPGLDAHVTAHPWREKGWRLLATALYRSERQVEALEVIRRARERLGTELGLDPGPRLGALERDILTHADDAATGLWAATAATYQQVAPSGSPLVLQSTVAVLGDLAVMGGTGLAASRQQRLATVDAAERLDDAELAATIIGSFDVPGIWPRSDDPEQAARVVAAARRVLLRLPSAAVSPRARLLATVALESRGTDDPDAVVSARDAVRLARDLGDPRVLALALSGSYMQCFERTGLAAERDSIGRELIDLSTRFGLTNFLVMGELVRMHARSALGRFEDAAGHAESLDALAARHGRPAITVFTTWFRAMRHDAEGHDLTGVEAGYRHAAESLHGAGMPGVENGALALALLGARLTRNADLPVLPRAAWGPYFPWVRPQLLVALGRRADALKALDAAPDPVHDNLAEAMWSLLGDAALALDDRRRAGQALDHLGPAAGEIAGAGSGMLCLWPVARTIERLKLELPRTRA
ncbi:AfsR/SARP family transcriptional regulator [Actinoplanes solisilvae]|uniref:AfsR/SARP family transcriptional regulator n=1 Tax=Actinoplanes solisilvae TaxID=2486853 RepID=UPI000FDB2249|nr:AfsR/SARP family transcriptional regulator [Actinoplanes solisilvae]